MSDSTTGAEGLARLTRWQLGHTQPKRYSLDLDHPVQEDLAWASDTIAQQCETNDALRQTVERLQAELGSDAAEYRCACVFVDGEIQEHCKYHGDLLAQVERLELQNEALRAAKDLDASAHGLLYEGLDATAKAEINALRSQVEKLRDPLDLMRDEFLRIKALSPGDEVDGIATRAISEIERRVPVVQELERAKQALRELEQQNRDTEFLYHAFAVLCWDAGLKPGSRELLEAADRFNAALQGADKPGEGHDTR